MDGVTELDKITSTVLFQNHRGTGELSITKELRGGGADAGKVLAQLDVVLVHPVSRLEAVKDDPFQRDALPVQVGGGQPYGVDGAQPGVRHQQAAQAAGPDHVGQPKLLSVKPEGAEDAARALHCDIVIAAADRLVALQDPVQTDRPALQLGGQMGGDGVFVDVGAHLLQGLVQARDLFHIQGVARDQRPVRTALVAAHGGLVVGGGGAVPAQCVHNQAGDEGFAHIGPRPGDKQSLAHSRTS